MPRYNETICKRIEGRWKIRHIERNEMHCLYMQELCHEWLEDKKVFVKTSTYALYYNIISNHILPYFNGFKCSSLTNSKVNSFIKQKIIDGLSAKTIRDIGLLLIQIIKYAQSRGYIPDFNYKLAYPKIQISDLSVLTQGEQSRLTSYIQINFDIQKIGVLLSLYMGIRLGELCALKWGDINFENETLLINKTLQRVKNTDKDKASKTKIIIDAPKSQKSIRAIPIPSFILAILKKHKNNSDNYVLSGTDKYIEPRVYQNKFKQYLKNCGVVNINFHALRHTFATRAIEQEFDLKSLSEILGHSSVRFTLERYVHPSNELKKMNMEKLAVYY